MTTSHDIQRPLPADLFDTRAFGFSQVVVAPCEGRAVFVSGQFSGDRDGKVVGESVEQQMPVCFENLRRAIAGAGARPEHVVQIRVLIVDHREDYLAPLAREVGALFGDALPASTLIPVPRLALDSMLFEIEATLFVPGRG